MTLFLWMPRPAGLCSQIFCWCLTLDLLNTQRSPMLAVPLVSLQMEVARRKERDITTNKHLGNVTPVLIWKWRTCVQLCLTSERSLTMEPSFLSLFATTCKRAISFWLTGPENQKTTGNSIVAPGQNHSPYHGKTSGDEAFGVDQVCFHPWRRYKAKPRPRRMAQDSGKYMATQRWKIYVIWAIGMLGFQPLASYKEHGKSLAYLPNLNYREPIYRNMCLEDSRCNWARKVMINLW